MPPIQDFLPGAAAAGIDEGGIYLLKGSTLKKLLKTTDFSEQDFIVDDKGDARTVSLQKKGKGGSAADEGEGEDFNITIAQCGETPVADVTEVATIYVRQGKASLTDPGGDTPGSTVTILTPFSCSDFSGP